MLTNLKTYLTGAKVWLERIGKKLGLILLILSTLLGILWLILSLIHGQREIAATLLVGLIAAGVVWWQGSLIKKQIQFQSFIELDKESNSAEMLETCQTAFNKSTKQYDLFKLEGILEFLEKARFI